MTSETSRRAVLTTAVWSVPVIAATAAVPLAAASIATEFGIAVAGSPTSGPSTVTVSIPASALPITAGTVTLEYRRTTGTGFISSASFGGGWTHSWPSSTVLRFFPPASPPLTENVFQVTFSGPATWVVELQTTQGTFSGVIEVVAPV